MTKKEEPKTYEVQAMCVNCGVKGHLEVTKGTAVSEVLCDGCGCEGQLRTMHTKRILETVAL